MATLTPLDIRKKEFSQSAFGYNKDAVKLFLDDVIEAMEKHIEEKNGLKKEIATLKDKIDDFTRLEKSIQETLMMAKDSGKQAMETAIKEAEVTLNKAKTEKEALLFSAKEELTQVQNQMFEIKSQRERFVIQFKSSLKNHLELLDNLYPDTAKQPGIENVDEPTIDFNSPELSIADLDEMHKHVVEEEAPVIDDDIVSFDEEAEDEA
jgi:cell division initiation protein